MPPSRKVSARKVWNEIPEHVAGGGKAVQQHDGRIGRPRRAMEHLDIADRLRPELDVHGLILR